MVVPSGSTERNDRIEKRSTSLGEMTFYWVMNIDTWPIYKRCHPVFITLRNLYPILYVI